MINAILDDGSTKSYINSDVPAQLGLQSNVRNVTVKVLNGQESAFQMMPVEFELISLDGSKNVEMSAFTTRRVTGDLHPIKWRVESGRWKHLKGIHFPNLDPRPIIDMLIGIDYAELHYSLKDV